MVKANSSANGKKPINTSNVKKMAIQTPSKEGGEIGEAESEINLFVPNGDEIQQDENEGSQHVPNHLQNCFNFILDSMCFIPRMFYYPLFVNLGKIKENGQNNLPSASEEGAFEV